MAEDPTVSMYGDEIPSFEVVRGSASVCPQCHLDSPRRPER